MTAAARRSDPILEVAERRAACAVDLEAADPGDRPAVFLVLAVLQFHKRAAKVPDHAF